MGHVELDGAVAVVTGASRGIGASTARALVEHGAKVIALGHEADELIRAAADIGATSYVADVRDPAHAEDVVAHALDLHGRLDIVVANAGLGYAGRFLDMPTDRIDDLIQINVRAPILLAKAALPTMIEQRRGVLVFVSSIAGNLLVPDEAVYSATKAAVEAFAEPLREELRGTGVRVTTVVPAVVDTGFFDHRGEPYDRTFPRPVPPDRLASAIVGTIVHRRNRRVVPAWFRIPMRIRGLAPRIYRVLSRWFG